MQTFEEFNRQTKKETTILVIIIIVVAIVGTFWGNNSNDEKAWLEFRTKNGCVMVEENKRTDNTYQNSYLCNDGVIHWVNTAFDRETDKLKGEK